MRPADPSECSLCLRNSSSPEKGVGLAMLLHAFAADLSHHSHITGNSFLCQQMQPASSGFLPSLRLHTFKSFAWYQAMSQQRLVIPESMTMQCAGRLSACRVLLAQAGGGSRAAGPHPAPLGCAHAGRHQGRAEAVLVRGAAMSSAPGPQLLSAAAMMAGRRCVHHRCCQHAAGFACCGTFLAPEAGFCLSVRGCCPVSR